MWRPRQPEDLPDARGDGRADLHDRPLAPAEPPVPIVTAPVKIFSIAIHGGWNPPLRMTDSITSTMPCPSRVAKDVRAEARRPQPARCRDQDQQPHALAVRNSGHPDRSGGRAGRESQ